MAVEITDERIAAAAARLHEGGWCFTPRQLYYAVCADVDTPPVRVASSEVGLGLVLILVGIIIANRVALAILGGAGLLLLAVGVMTHLQERRPPAPGRLLATSFTAFAERLAAGGHAYAGMLLERPADAGGAPEGAPLVVCDRAETAAILTANATRLGPARVVLRGEEPEEIGAVRVIAIHDCDPAGCAVVPDLRDRGADVMDAGINPAELAGRRIQQLEGAPARLPRDLSAHLTTEETDWLRSGRRLELATETPEQLVARVRSAIAG